jgi:hypothetical protein
MTEENRRNQFFVVYELIIYDYKVITLSKAFSKSVYITSVCLPFEKDSSIACFIVIRLVTDYLLLRNPCWCGTMFLKIGVSLLLIIFENILGRIDIIEIGR